MAKLYPSWIEIPVNDIDRARTFYRAVFGLTNTSEYDDEPATRIVVLLPSEKSVGNPGVSLVHSPRHKPCSGGAQINFHVGEHEMLTAAIDAIFANGGSITEPITDTGDGVKYIVALDCEGNTIALSSYEPLGVED